MSNPFNDPISRASIGVNSIDEGLRSYMIRIYNQMALGLGITGLVSFLVASQPQLMMFLFGTPLLPYVIMFAPLIMVFLISAKLNQYPVSTLKNLFIVYSTLMGISLSTIFLVYTMDSIAKTFFITSALFLSMSILGYTTKRDLTSFGSFLIMGVWGLFLAIIVNLFMQSSVLSMVISIVSVLIFTGLTAYDTQMLKELYDNRDSSDAISRKVIFGALNLYINFINIFISLLRLFGDRR